jgi:hypothetical protein
MVTNLEGGVMKKTFGALLALVVGAIGFAVAHNWMGQDAMNVANQVEEGFRIAVAQIRPTLPKKVDNATTFVDISSAGMVLTHRYIVDTDNFELLPNFMQVEQSAVTGLACNTEDARKAMKVGAAYEYSYYDRKSKSLGGFVVTSADCK